MIAPLEPALALSELRHRMNNALQLVSNLIAREAQGAAEPAAQTLRKAEAQIQAFALLHCAIDCAIEPLTGEPCAAAYLAKLCAHLRAACLSPFDITLETALDAPCLLDEHRCRTLGLITTELVLNAAKHAFVDRDRGAVGVCLARRASPPNVVLGVIDDGCGMADHATGKGQGLTFVRRLADGIGGQCRIVTGDKGTHFAVVVPVAR